LRKDSHWTGLGNAPCEFTSDCRRLLTLIAADTLGLTDVATGQLMQQFRLPEPSKGWTSVAVARLTGDGTLIALGHTSYEPSSTIRWEQTEPVRVWDTATGREV